MMVVKVDDFRCPRLMMVVKVDDVRCPRLTLKMVVKVDAVR